MLTPEDRAELERIRDAKEQRDLWRWETQVVRRALARGATGPEIADVLGVSKMQVSHIKEREFPDTDATDVAGGAAAAADTDDA